MITRASNVLVVEGNMVPTDPEAGSETVPARIEIDTASGLIQAVTTPRGAGDLVLGDEYIIFPAFIDCHVHAREDASGAENYKENFRTAGEAAVRGGVAAFVDMPNNPRPPADNDTYRQKRDLAAESSVDVLLYACLGPDTRPLSFPVPYKAYMGPSVGHIFFEDEESLREALAHYHGHFVAFHAELPEILRRHRKALTHAERRPPEAEVEAIDLALRVSENYQIEPHICHLSTAEGLELIRDARDRGLKVSCEVTPHHLYYDQDNAGVFARPEYLQCNPPIRSRLDRIALLEGLRSGDIDYLATDHAPHTIDEKESGASGVTHLDTYGSFVFWLLQEGFSFQQIRRVCAERPGRFLSRFLPLRYGKIAAGYAGSLTILKRTPVTIRRADLKTRAGWSVFEGQTFGGRVSHTIVRGQLHTLED